MSRSAAYEWLAEKMGLISEHCHMGYFNQKECATVLMIMEGWKRCSWTA